MILSPVKRLLVTAAWTAILSGSTWSQAAKYPPEMPGAETEVYKTVGDVRLNIYLFKPAGHQPTDKRPAIVFFFGGGWNNGSPAQFLNQCKTLASRGMIAAAADYRVASRHQSTILQSVQDAKSAVRWLRTHAARLGVDPERIAAGGGSAGGHLAACTGLIPGLDESGEDQKVSSRSNALVLYNPALVLAGVSGESIKSSSLEALLQRSGIELERISPYHAITRGAPPAIIFHGTADTTVPFRTVELFAAAMKSAGNSCQVVPFEGRTHGFFNFGRGDSSDYRAVLRETEDFLTEQGYLKKYVHF
jgi:acetyl esterase